jgi:hypothetical protein
LQKLRTLGVERHLLDLVTKMNSYLTAKVKKIPRLKYYDIRR